MLTVYWSHIVDEQREANERARRASLRKARIQKETPGERPGILSRMHLGWLHIPRQAPIAH